MKKVLIPLIFALSSCAAFKPISAPQNWTVVSVQKDDFRAKYGRDYATFNKIPTDSVWIGKKITVSRGIK
jgi:hypothetical protein